VPKGVTRELGRSNCLLVRDARKVRGTGRSRALALNGRLPVMSESQMCGRHKGGEAHKVSGEDSEERTNLRGSVGSLS
jgi:hypothetical protein